MDREAAVEAGVAIGSVVVMAAVVIWVGSTYGGSDLGADGGLALVAAIAFFVVLMTAVGLGLSQRY